jgi:hypothetical protein
MDTCAEARQWAHEEFGTADLKDQRRTERLVQMAASAAQKPAGTITQVFPKGAEREAAYRLVENKAIATDQIAHAAHQATVRRCNGLPVVFAPIDGSSVTVTDDEQTKGFGRVGTTKRPNRGLHMLNAVAVTLGGVLIGLLGQVWWRRDEPKKKPKYKTKKDRALANEKETRFWVQMLLYVLGLFLGRSTCPWFQLDRGADCWPVLLWATQLGMLLTVRANANRRVVSASPRCRPYLWSVVSATPVLGRCDLHIPARRKRPARTARIRVRACPVTLDLHDGTSVRKQVSMYAVLAREQGRGKHVVEWMLLTTYPVATFEDACLVIQGYTTRWRIEEFHRAWKNGVCHVEDTQLRSVQAVLKWATILASVAARSVRLSYLARTEPDRPALSEFTPYEIDAAWILRMGTKPPAEVQSSTVGVVIGWIAEIGGYTGKSSGGPPGPTVIARGLVEVGIGARVLKAMEEKKM